MERRFTDQEVNLALFTDTLVEFFVKNDFEVVRGETEKGFEILAYDSPKFKLNGYVSVTIEGEENDFLVNFELCSESDKRRFPFQSYFLTTMLGGGHFLLQKLKSDEAFLKLEKEFWTYTERALD